MNELALCAGIGGISLGLKLVVPDLRTVCYVEREAFCIEHLVQKGRAGVLDEAPVWSDLESFDGQPWRCVVDLVTAGFPCQPFSTAGKRLGTADERWLWPDIARILGEVQPCAVFLENVPGLVRHGMADVLGTLAVLGFDAEWDVFSAAGVGAPHLRKRVFILAANAECRAGWLQPGRRLGQSRTDQALASHHGKPEEMADAMCGGLGPRIRHVQSEARQPDIDGCGAAVADSESSGLPQRQGLREAQAHAGSAGTDAWEVEPDVGRVADGVADRVHRLRSLGNGVVPLVVAYAFRTLATRLCKASTRGVG